MISQQPPDDFEELLAQLVEDRLTDEEHARLGKILLSDPDARARYRQLMRIHSLLHAGLARLPQVQADPLPAGAVSQPFAFVRLHPVRSFFRASVAKARKSTRLLVALVLVGAGLTTAYFWSGSGAGPIVQQAVEPPAMVTHTAMSEWETGFAPTGEVISQGQRLKLRRGFAAIRFGSQATTVVQGPAEFEIESQNSCRLLAGQLTARVPEAARGFTVHTPSGTVTDLGTEFGVAVNFKAPTQKHSKSEIGAPATAGHLKSQISSTEVHVFRGEVEVTADFKTSQTQTVTSGAGVLIDTENDTLKPLTADSQRFTQTMPVALSIVNHDFEDGPLLGNGKFGYDVPGWQASFNTNCLDPNENPQFNNEGRSFYKGSDQPPGTGVLGAMAGPQVASLSWGKIVPVFSQTLTETLQPNTKYILTVAVGVRNLGLSINTRDFGGCYLELLSGGERLGLGVRADFESLNHLAGGSAHGTFSDFSYTFVTGPDVPPDQPLGIRISKMRNTRNTYLDFDNVRLLAIPLTSERQQP